MNIPALVVERHAVVGDQWRQRYPTLSLHTTKNHHTRTCCRPAGATTSHGPIVVLYQPYPKNWPTYTPRNKVADWLKQYVESQDLVVWTKSQIKPGATYDSSSKRWNVVVRRDDQDVELHPVHVIIATGALGAPRIPEVPGADIFKGAVYHASKYMGGQPYAGKDCIVVGAGNTSADLCQDLSFRGAKSVTMVQRSSTCVVHINTVAGAMAKGYPDGVPYEICDIKFNSMPINLQRTMAREREAEMWEREKPLHDQLRKGGVKLNMGTDGSGQHFLIFERSGGTSRRLHLLATADAVLRTQGSVSIAVKCNTQTLIVGAGVDVGCAPLIESGKVKVKQGVEVDRFTENGVIFSDGSKQPADLVIWA